MSGKPTEQLRRPNGALDRAARAREAGQLAGADLRRTRADNPFTALGTATAWNVGFDLGRTEVSR